MLATRVLCGWMLIFIAPLVVVAQAPKKPVPVNSRALDLEAQKVETEYLKGLSTLATSYEEAGEKEKAEAMLQQILKLRPDLESVKMKLKELEESVFKDQQELIDLDTGKGWISTGILVEKGKKLRVEATGTYKLIISDDLGPEGYHSEDSNGADYFEGAPTGALIGVIVPPGGTPSGKKGEGPQPFLLGTQKELDPRENGLLVVRVNAPAQAKCVGRLKIRLSGNMSKVGK